MALSPQWLDELRARVTLSGVISRTTRLQKAGREFKACCPFHNEKSPSFTVNDEKGFYHCFGCGAHGDVIRWMTDQRGLAFMDAVKELAAEAGMEVPAADPRAARQAEQRASLHDVMTAAQDWFAANLAGPGGAAARDYLAGRGFDARTIDRFGFGFAPDDRQALKAALACFPEEMLVEAGLRIAVDDDDGTRREPYDRFRGRLMLPIHDARGRVIAFGGRILDDRGRNVPKYLNSPDTPLFDKGRTLYNLHRAGPVARKSGRLIVVEGYMDVIALAAAGIEEAVAPLGTALTETQIGLLWRVCDTPVLCFDGDAAGQRAAMRAVSRALPLLRPAHSLRIARLPAGTDPDDLVRAQGPQAMEGVVSAAADLVDAIWQTERAALPVASPEEKAGLKARLMAHVDVIGDNDIRALYRRALLDRYSAFAFPPRSERAWKKGSPGPNEAAQGLHTSRLRKSAEGGSLSAFAAAILAGLVRWPEAITRNAEALAQASRHDWRFAELLDIGEQQPSLESGDLRTILASNGVFVPGPEDLAGLRFGFLADEASTDTALRDLETAIGLMVERPALDAALADATARFERELNDEAYDEQQRLLKRKLEFDARLRQMASAQATVP